MGSYRGRGSRGVPPSSRSTSITRRTLRGDVVFIYRISPRCHRRPRLRPTSLLALAGNSLREQSKASPGLVDSLSSQVSLAPRGTFGKKARVGSLEPRCKNVVWTIVIRGIRFPAAGHRLELPVRELSGLAGRRGAGKHQVDGVLSLLHGHHPHLLGQPRAQLLLHGRFWVSEELLPEGVVLDASLDYPALHLGACASGCFGHVTFPLALLSLQCVHAPEGGRLVYTVAVSGDCRGVITPVLLAR